MSNDDFYVRVRAGGGNPEELRQLLLLMSYLMSEYFRDPPERTDLESFTCDGDIRINAVHPIPWDVVKLCLKVFIDSGWTPDDDGFEAEAGRLCERGLIEANPRNPTEFRITGKGRATMIAKVRELGNTFDLLRV